MFGLYGDLPPPSAAAAGDAPVSSGSNSREDGRPSISGTQTSSWSASNKLFMAPPRKPSLFGPPPSVLRAQSGSLTQKSNPKARSSSESPLSAAASPLVRSWGPLDGASSGPGPLAAGNGGSVVEQQPALVGASAAVTEEYDPARPNDYEDYVAIRRRKKLEEDMRRDEERRRKEEAEREKARERELERERQRMLDRERDHGNGASDEDARAGLRVSGEDAWKRRGMLSGGGPPPRRSPSPPASGGLGLGAKPSGGGGGLTFAQKMMEKMGWKEGQGLGKQEQGITTALMAKKTAGRSGVIVNASELRPPGPPPEKRVKSATFTGTPTRVVMLRNMVGPGEVDDELEEETAGECAKYGTVTRVMIFEVTEPNFPPTEAVRIFIQFDRSEAATKALVDLDGRFFGGRVVKATFFDEEKFEKHQLAPAAGEVPGYT